VTGNKGKTAGLARSDPRNLILSIAELSNPLYAISVNLNLVLNTHDWSKFAKLCSGVLHSGHA
jgi:hypothetical protein